MKRVVAFFGLTLLLLSLAAPGRVLAHTLRVDRNISALLHIAPYDLLYPGTKSKFLLYFDDLDNKFDTANCDCRYTISPSNGQAVSGSIEAFAKTIGRLYYLPAKEDVYSIRVTGVPLGEPLFQAFTLNFLERASRYKPITVSYEDYAYQSNPLSVNCYGQCLDSSAQQKVILLPKANLYGY